MKPQLLIYDDALWDADFVRAGAVRLDYRGEVGPDGVTYPNISSELPSGLLPELERLCSQATRSPIEVKLPPFFRLSLSDTVAPHWAHTDQVISDYLALVYLSAPEHCVGGTAIVEHRSGMARQPQTEAEVALWREDTNHPERWLLKTIAPMKFNRMVIMPTDVFHAAVPQGFGSSTEDGRLVLTTFFSRKG